MPGPIKKTGSVLFHIWFYFLTALPIFTLLPLLLIFTLSERTYSQFYWLARNVWASFILYGMGCFPKITYEESMKAGKSYMLVANHASMLDIMLMLRTSKQPFIFVGKKELVKIPVFGFFYKRVSIMVDRESIKSRTGVYIRAQKRISKGLSVCIFPEGGVPPPDVVLDKFKDGAFKMAIAHQIPLVPITFYDTKKRLPFDMYKGGPGILRVKVHRFIQTETYNLEDYKQLKAEVRNSLLKSLLKD